MPFPTIERLLRERLAGTLPGLEAHRRYAPSPRALRHAADATGIRTAAGLLLLYPGDGDVWLPLTVRSETLRRHAGQVSLPGGVIDAGESLADAALREATEEVGVERGAVRVLGELTPVHITVSGFTLHPVVGVTDTRPAFTAAAAEVDAILEVPLGDLRDASRLKRGTRKVGDLTIEYPYFDLHGREVWGATAMVLGELVTMLEAGGQIA